MHGSLEDHLLLDTKVKRLLTTSVLSSPTSDPVQNSQWVAFFSQDVEHEILYYWLPMAP